MARTPKGALGFLSDPLYPRKAGSVNVHINDPAILIVAPYQCPVEKNRYPPGNGKSSRLSTKNNKIIPVPEFQITC